MHVRRVLPLLVAAGISLGVAACGATTRARARAGLCSEVQRRRGRLQRRAAGRGQEGRSSHRAGGRRRRLRRPRPDLLRFGYMIHYAVNRTLYSYGPGDNEKPRPDIADGEPQISSDQKTHHGQAQEGHQVQPAGQPRDHVEGHQVRLRARVQLARALAVRLGLLRRPRRRAEQARRDQGHPGDRDARRLDDRLQAEGPERGARLAGAGDADLDAGAAGVREASSTPRRRRPTTSTSSSPARTCTRTTLGQARRAHAGQEHRARPQPQLGRQDRLPPGLPGLDHGRGGQRRLRLLVAARPQRPGPRPGRRHHAGAGDQAGAHAATRTRSPSSPAAATASSR